MFGRRSTADEVRELALMALASALQEQVKGMQRRKPLLGGVRAVAAGAVLYTAGRAVAPKLREQLEAQRDGDERSQDESYDEDEYEEPQAQSRDEDESYDEDEYEEPQAERRDEDDESYDEDQYEEPQAEGRDEDESYDEDEADEEEQGPAERPQRSRSPVGRP